MLIVGHADSGAAHLPDEIVILILHGFRSGPTDLLATLVEVDTMVFVRLVVQDQPLCRVDSEGANSKVLDDFVEHLSLTNNLRADSVQVRVADAIPPVRTWNSDPGDRFDRRPG